MGRPWGLEEFVRQCRSQGMDNPKIITSLVQAGWPADQVQRYLSSQPAPRGVSIRINVVLLTTLVAAGILTAIAAAFWFFSPQLSSTPDAIRNYLASVPSPENPAVATVFGTPVYLDEIRGVAAMVAASNDTAQADMRQRYGAAGSATDEAVAVSMATDWLVTAEAIRRVGSTPTTADMLVAQFRQRMDGRSHRQIMQQYGLGDEYWDTVVRVSAMGSWATELTAAVAGQPQPAYHGLLAKRVQKMHDAFAKQLRTMDAGSQELLRLRRGSDWAAVFPGSDPNFLPDELDQPVGALTVPGELRTSLQSLMSTPNVLTPVVDDGTYLYFGMVFTPTGSGNPAGLSRDDVLVVRFPWVAGFYDQLIMDLTWEEGVATRQVSVSGVPEYTIDQPSLRIDADGDLLPDYLEAAFGSSPTKVDTDGDGRGDLLEYENGTDPTKKN
ncbi:MAG: hypothetical protein V1916_03540 [Patescibacteria group bacterium]